MAKVYQRYNTKMGKTICQLLLEGKSFEEISKIPGMPSLKIMHKWLLSEDLGGNKEFRELWLQSLMIRTHDAIQEWSVMSSEEHRPTIEDYKNKYPTYTDKEIKDQMSADASHRRLRKDYLLAVINKFSGKTMPELADKQNNDPPPDKSGAQFVFVNYKPSEEPQPFKPIEIEE